MADLTNDQVRAIIDARKPHASPLIVVVWPYVGEDQYELCFHLRWDLVLENFEACSVIVEGQEWRPADVYGMSTEQEVAFKQILFRLYGIEHVCFSPDARVKASMEKVNSRVTTLLR